MCGQGNPLEAKVDVAVTICEVPLKRCTLSFPVPHLAKQHMEQDIYIQEA